MREHPIKKAASIDSQLYQAVFREIKTVFKQHFAKATPMYVDPTNKEQLFGWHLLLSKDKENADYFVLYETNLFESVAQVRLLRGELQIQYTLERNNVILLSQFRISDLDEYTDWDDYADNGVITISESISTAEANGLLNFLKSFL